MLDDLLLAVDSGNSAILVLLDLNFVFDTTDLAILLERLRHFVGIQGTVFKWFKSYVCD